jgi:hypothetical protein
MRAVELEQSARLKMRLTGFATIPANADSGFLFFLFYLNIKAENKIEIV